MKQTKDLGELFLDRHGKKIYVRDGIVTKVYDHLKYSGSDVMKEAMNQQYAYESGFAVPKVYALYPLGEDWALESEEIKGETMESMMKRDPEHKKKYISQLVKIQISVLSKLSDNLKLPKLKDKLHAYIQDSGLDATTRYDLNARLEKMPNHYKMCHGDIYPNNLILSGDKWYILDWAHVTRGNASADAAMTYLLFLLDGDESGAKMYLKEICKKLLVPESYVQTWISVVSATKLKTATDERGKELLMQNIDVVEYY